MEAPPHPPPPPPRRTPLGAEAAPAQRSTSTAAAAQSHDNNLLAAEPLDRVVRARLARRRARPYIVRPRPFCSRGCLGCYRVEQQATCTGYSDSLLTLHELEDIDFGISSLGYDSQLG